MLVTSYNNQSLDDVLVVMTMPPKAETPHVTRRENIAQLTDQATGEVLGYNVFEASTLLGELTDGPVTLTDAQVDHLNSALKDAGFDEELVADPSPKFVIGDVKTCVPHEDSDHLSITQVDVGDDEELQIVCGASNIAAGQKVVVAKPGAVMPSGLVIWPGSLRGVKSNGMICSAKELELPESEWAPGIMVLPEDAAVGAEYKF